MSEEVIQNYEMNPTADESNDVNHLILTMVVLLSTILVLIACIYDMYELIIFVILHIGLEYLIWKSSANDNQSFECPRSGCGRRYKHSASLYNHMKYECGVSEGQFTCEHCGRKFKRKSSYKSHMIVRHRCID